MIAYIDAFKLLAIALVRPKQLFFWFCAFWFVAALMIYSWAGEKMPWLLVHVAADSSTIAEGPP